MINIRRSEAVNFYSHLAGALAMPFAMAYLLSVSSKSATEIVSILVYGLSVMMLFSASALYHYKKKEENEKTIWRTFDHISIFFMIAGTYTPFCLLVLDGVWSIVIISVQWGLVVLGLIQKLIWLRAPRWFTAAVYVAMGWVAVFALKPLYDNSGVQLIILMFSAGIVYSIGALIYAMKKPNPIPNFFGFHEIFHVLILVATAILYYDILQIVRMY